MQSEQNPQYVPTNMMILKAKPSGRLWDCIETDLLGTAMEQQQGSPTREVTYELALDPASSAGGRRLRANRMENPNWCRNPQIFLNFKRPTCLKIVLERHLGKRRNTHGTTVGFTVTRLQNSTEPKPVTKQKKKASPGATFATTGGIRPPEQ